MSDQEILEKAIQKAIDNNWKPFESDYKGASIVSYGFSLQMLDDPFSAIVRFAPTYNESVRSETPHLIHILKMLYGHDFAKALWGDEPKHRLVTMKDGDCDRGFKTFGDTIDYYNWQYHLQQLAIAESLLEYLRDNI